LKHNLKGKIMKNEKSREKKIKLSKETIVRLSSWRLNEIKGGHPPTKTKPQSQGSTFEGSAASISNDCCG
jgi:hypothetical protein